MAARRGKLANGERVFMSCPALLELGPLKMGHWLRLPITVFNFSTFQSFALWPTAQASVPGPFACCQTIPDGDRTFRDGSA
jgi:predicted LPLAT superfamily acyltransferase